MGQQEHKRTDANSSPRLRVQSVASCLKADRPSLYFQLYGIGNWNDLVSDRGMICRATSLHLVLVKYVIKTKALMSSSYFPVTSQVLSSGWTWTQTCATCLIPSPGATRTSTAPTSPPKCLPTASTIQAGESTRRWLACVNARLGLGNGEKTDRQMGPDPEQQEWCSGLCR